MSWDPARLDTEVRCFVYGVALRRGDLPTRTEVGAALGAHVEEIASAFERLASDHRLVLQPGNRKILMAMPFSAVPTPFLVDCGNVQSYGNCIWNALGIPAMLRRDAQIMTTCGCCNAPMRLEVLGGALQDAPGVVHFAVPARQWWDDPVFT